MSSTEASEGPKPQTNGTTTPPPALPPNVSIFTPTNPPTATATLLAAGLFTRLTISNSATSQASRLTAALGAHRATINDSFCLPLPARNVVVVFDAAGDADAHHEHVRAVCLALRDADLGLDIAGCVFDAAGSVAAGVQMERLSGGGVMVVDIMGGGDDEEDDEDDDSDEDGGLESLGEAGVAE